MSAEQTNITAFDTENQTRLRKLDKDDPEHYHPYWYPKKYEELQPTT